MAVLDISFLIFDLNVELDVALTASIKKKFLFFFQSLTHDLGFKMIDHPVGMLLHVGNRQVK